ncbi:protein SPA1-RELATED 4-like isoform X2 [Telopea speciosissima]|uniref:protein SPA1-RELATED 4-like isoform X2 n=1 Tax=Telopea speciosissima TaxID=54955 RepID=UPI001CC576EB|nr:protein SPA1-RELATED 4-like isoform X2 [Telopea speciosissima]
MEGSSESRWEKSDSSSELNACVVSSGSLGLAHTNTNRFGVSGDEKETVTDWVFQPGSAHLDNQVVSPGVCGDAEAVGAVDHALDRGDVSLRQWLDKPDRSVDIPECLHIFRQIVENVNLAHAQGIVVHNVRPSCFVMSSFNRVSFIESSSCSSSGSDSYGNALNNQTLGGRNYSSPSPQDLPCRGGRIAAEDSLLGISRVAAFFRASETSCLRSGSAYPTRPTPRKEREGNKIEGSRKMNDAEENRKDFPLKQILLMEANWYTSPEEVAGASSSFSSDIYRLGILLFELFFPFSLMDEKLRTMSNLRHRVLPPQLLLKRPKEASFCLWLLHPQPSTRPKMSDLLQSEFLNEPKDNLEEHQAAINLREEIEEQELMLEFLLQMQQRKQEAADKLCHAICCLSSDIEEVLKQQSILKKKGDLYPEPNKDDNSALERVDHPSLNLARGEGSAALGSRKRFRPGFRVSDEEELNENQGEVQKPEYLESILSKSSRLMKNFKKLEAAYFLTRCRLLKPTGKPCNRCSPISSSGKGSIVVTEGSSVDNVASKEGFAEDRRSGWINTFLEGLCKYLSFSKLKVRADLKQGDLLNSSNLVCSLSFDRDGEFFATAGVNRKIKIFESDIILNEDRDIHYPVIEMASRSKLGSICWNGYIKSQIVSSDFDGIVQVWDVTRGQVFTEMREHEKRVWSVDFSLADPTKLASGSDDGSVKLWSINQRGSVSTIKTKANICCVQFPPDSAHSVAIGSADHKIYYYDLRSIRVPLYTLVGHSKTVSYVKFVDSTTLVSASTDNTLKLWDLSTCMSRVLDSPLQTFTGHTNMKNFVGLSVSDGYIATGSETNEVFIYHKAFPMPVLSFKFGSKDPLFGQEIDNASQFISSVCWRGQTSTLVAANSTGNIKLLEMV